MFWHWTFTSQFSLLVDRHKKLQQLQGDSINLQQSCFLIKGALKIKENGLTHDLGEDNPIAEIILWED